MSLLPDLRSPVHRPTARFRLALLLLILLGGTLLRSQELFKPWTGNHSAWGGAMYGNIARNFVKYGYLATRFGPVANTGTVEPADFEFYYHYPPLLVWLISASDHLFGVSEFSARLVPLVFSILLMLLVERFARRNWGDAVGLTAMAFCAVMPVETYYGAHVDIYNAVPVFFTLLAVAAYAQFRDGGRTRHLLLCALAVTLGCATTWYTYFLVPFLLLDHVLSRRPHSGIPTAADVCLLRDLSGPSRPHAVGRRRPPRPLDWRMLWIPACAVAIFGLFLLHRRLLLQDTGAEVHGTLLEKLWARLSYGNLLTDKGVRLSLPAYVLHHTRDLLRMFTPPLVALTALWLLAFLRDWRNRRLHSANGLALMLLGYGFLHNSVFPSVVSGHDYLVCCHTPGIAITSAALLHRLATRARRFSPVTGHGLLGGAVLAVLASGLYMTQRLHDWDPRYALAARERGEIVRQHTAPTDLVLWCAPADQVLAYYADRRIRFGVSQQAQVQELCSREPSNCYFACPSILAAQQPAVAWLRQQHEPHHEDKVLVFRVPSPTQPPAPDPSSDERAPSNP